MPEVDLHLSGVKADKVKNRIASSWLRIVAKLDASYSQLE